MGLCPVPFSEKGRRRRRKGLNEEGCIGEPDSVDADEQQRECASDDNGDMNFVGKPSVEDSEEELKVPRRLAQNVRGECGCGGSSGDARGRRRDSCRCSDEGIDYRNKGEIPGASRKPESAARTKETAKQRRYRETTFQRAVNIRTDLYGQHDRAKFGRETSLSRRRRPQSANSSTEDGRNGDADSVDENDVREASEFVRFGQTRFPIASPESKNSLRSGASNSSAMCWEEEEKKEKEEEDEERGSCALARKRALLPALSCAPTNEGFARSVAGGGKKSSPLSWSRLKERRMGLALLERWDAGRFASETRATASEAASARKEHDSKVKLEFASASWHSDSLLVFREASWC